MAATFFLKLCFAMVVAMVTPACFPTKKQEMTLNIFHIEMHYYTQVNTKLLREKKSKPI